MADRATVAKPRLALAVLRTNLRHFDVEQFFDRLAGFYRRRLAGALDYLRRPVDEEQLRVALGRARERRPQRESMQQLTGGLNLPPGMKLPF